MSDDPLSYYTGQSLISDLGRYAALFDDLPTDVPTLCVMLQGLVVHFGLGSLHGVIISPERQAEVNTSWVEPILACIVELDDAPLTVPRPPERRFVGCCRDFSLLLTACY